MTKIKKRSYPQDKELLKTCGEKWGIVVVCC